MSCNDCHYLSTWPSTETEQTWYGYCRLKNKTLYFADKKTGCDDHLAPVRDEWVQKLWLENYEMESKTS